MLNERGGLSVSQMKVINSILDSFGIKESLRTGTLVVWSLCSIRLILFVYEVDLDPNEHIFDWIKFFLVCFVYITPFTLMFLVTVYFSQHIMKFFEGTLVFRFIGRILDVLFMGFRILTQKEDKRKGDYHP